jgi:hypothetical protein
VPPRSWTAWPLGPDVVPRTGEQIGPEDGEDEWTLKRREPQRPSRELEDILMAITLRISRDRFERREWENSQEGNKGKAEGTKTDLKMGSDRMDIAEPETMDEGPTEEMLQDALRGTQEDRSQDHFAQVDQDSMRGYVPHEAEERLDDISILKEGAEPPLNEPPILERPAVSADDERSRRLLRPTIRHTLSQLDELLMALHNARQTCLHYASEHTESQSEYEGGNKVADDSGNEDPSHLPSSTLQTKQAPEQPAKRLKPGRPPKVLHMPAPSAVDTLESIEPYKKERRGRKRKLHVPLEGESHEEMLVRIARLQKKAIPFTVPRAGSVSSSPTKSARGSPQKRGTSAHTREKRSTRLGLRDWSEIIGTAALIGFSPEVIERATQRCANLFGEGMTILSFVENPTSGNEDQIVDYLPGEIPDFDNLENYSTARSGSDDDLPKTGRRPSRGLKRNRLRSENEMDISKSEAEIRISSGVDTTYYCPYPACLRHKQGFSKKRYLSTHLKDIHKLDKRELKEVQEESQEEMEGGVHINGFMKEVKRRTGWRALDGKPRRRKKSGGRMKTEESEGEVPEKEELSEESGGGWNENESDLDEAFESG